MIRFTPPSPELFGRFLIRQSELSYSYPSPGATGNGHPPPGFVVDHRQRQLGRGAAAFDAARAAMRDWEMSRHGWATIRPEPPIAAGTAVSMQVRFVGLWWINACRIVYVIDEPRRFGFAYGTLPGHVERGEERFLIEWREDDSVWYDLYAFSRPRAWIVWLTYPLVRRLQSRFALSSLDAMERAVRHRTSP